MVVGQYRATQLLLFNAEHLQLGAHAIKVIRLADILVVVLVDVGDLASAFIVVVDTLRQTDVIRLVVVETGCWVVGDVILWVVVVVIWFWNLCKPRRLSLINYVTQTTGARRQTLYVLTLVSWRHG